ncbi:hypothetical protein B0H67DRAFT_642798 [Lasiosphaeris hirsuta]|uniref:Uncharacterized protein n=1 Tax=Lasiosphaeris hirsuta TaxID=260670 RepID=A0AA40AP67_9PEZI|nr:hypothetical protein B0H67DRAFT_642798 [Lasiosphaeris hirsuta]
MDSISYSLATAAQLNQLIHAELKATDNRATDDQEASESQDAKAQAMSALHSTKSLLAATLANLRSVKKRAPSKAVTASALRLGRSLINSMPALPMASGQSYLDQFSASLSTVPVIGIKNNQVMYLATLPSVRAKSGVKNAWAYFSALPDGVTVDGSTNVHLFPYKGNLFISVGRAVWKKKCRDLSDPTTRQEAVDNWPKMYVNKWEKVGDDVLPSADVLDIIPFAALSVDRNQIEFRLLILGSDKAVQVLKSDDIYASNEWTLLQYQAKAGDKTTLPAWKRMAYWNNSVVALDDQSNTWDLQPNFQNRTYTISDKTAIESTSELTATDMGPIAVRKDSFLYNRVVQDAPSDGKDPALEWQKGMAQDRTSVYPIVGKMSAFALTHKTYLDLLLQAADDYEKSEGDDQKQAIAIKAGKEYVTHAMVWSKMLSTSVNATKATVNVMTSQLHDNFTDLDSMYGTLNVFWVQQLAPEIFEDISSVVASKDVTDKLNEAALKYLDTLNKQGVTIPPDSSDLRANVLVRTSLKVAEASLKSTKAAKAKFQAASAGYEAVLKQIESNPSTIQQKLDQTDKDIGSLEQQERDKIIWITADTIALACAAAITFASAGAFGPVAVALTTAEKIGLGAAATAAATSNRISTATLKSLKVVQPLFANVVKAADDVESAVSAMVDGLEAVRGDTAKGQVLA